MATTYGAGGNMEKIGKILAVVAIFVGIASIAATWNAGVIASFCLGVVVGIGVCISAQRQKKKDDSTATL